MQALEPLHRHGPCAQFQPKYEAAFIFLLEPKRLRAAAAIDSDDPIKEKACIDAAEMKRLADENWRNRDLLKEDDSDDDD